MIEPHKSLFCAKDATTSLSERAWFALLPTAPRTAIFVVFVLPNNSLSIVSTPPLNARVARPPKVPTLHSKHGKLTIQQSSSCEEDRGPLRVTTMKTCRCKDVFSLVYMPMYRMVLRTSCLSRQYVLEGDARFMFPRILHCPIWEGS